MNESYKYSWDWNTFIGPDGGWQSLQGFEMLDSDKQVAGGVFCLQKSSIEELFISIYLNVLQEKDTENKKVEM